MPMNKCTRESADAMVQAQIQQAQEALLEATSTSKLSAEGKARFRAALRGIRAVSTSHYQSDIDRLQAELAYHTGFSGGQRTRQ